MRDRDLLISNCISDLDSTPHESYFNVTQSSLHDHDYDGQQCSRARSPIKTQELSHSGPRRSCDTPFSGNTVCSVVSLGQTLTAHLFTGGNPHRGSA